MGTNQRVASSKLQVGLCCWRGLAPFIQGDQRMLDIYPLVIDSSVSHIKILIADGPNAFHAKAPLRLVVFVRVCCFPTFHGARATGDTNLAGVGSSSFEMRSYTSIVAFTIPSALALISPSNLDPRNPFARWRQGQPQRVKHRRVWSHSCQRWHIPNIRSYSGGRKPWM